MKISQETVTVATTGSAGSAIGNTDSGPIRGLLLDIFFDFTSMPATTDITVSYGNPADGNILVLTNVNADGLYAPRKQCCDPAGAAITGVFDKFPLNGTVNIAIAQGDANASALV